MSSDPAPAAPTAEALRGASILLYDGVCGLCDRTVRFTLRRDRRARFRFAALQSDFARAALARHGKDARDLDTVCLIVGFGEPAERLLTRAEAILHILGKVGGVWRLVALAGCLPRGLLDRAYDLVAQRRYRWFGRYDHCPLPDPRWRDRFVDVG